MSNIISRKYQFSGFKHLCGKFQIKYGVLTSIIHRFPLKLCYILTFAGPSERLRLEDMGIHSNDTDWLSSCSWLIKQMVEIEFPFIVLKVLFTGWSACRICTTVIHHRGVRDSLTIWISFMDWQITNYCQLTQNVTLWWIKVAGFWLTVHMLLLFLNISD